MQFSLRSLQKFFKTPLPSSKLEHILTKAGLEVDAVEKAAPSFEGVVVAKVLATAPHPNADKLCVATVFDGEKEHQVVCGASNCRKNLITAFAPIGSALKDSSGKTLKIKIGKLRGVESFGMLLSAEELGLDEKSEGLVELGEEYPIGHLLASSFEDEIFEISFTPNLGHAMSHLGIAREISALLEKPYQIPPFPKPKRSSFETQKYIKVTVENGKDCFSYGCLLIKNIEIKESPLWLKAHLSSIGLKSINHVVDVTNYILHEIGHPMHAFDYDQIEGAHIEVRRAKEKQHILALDNQTYTAAKDSLLIYDKKKPIAIAGIMGAQNSQVNSNTKNILLEAAHFNPSLIRKTSKALNLYTDSSKHFERGVDGQNISLALERAASLISNISSGEISDKALILNPHKKTPKVITCSLKRINQLLGTHLKSDEIINILERLDCRVEEKDPVFSVIPPSYRHDLNIDVDLVEEVARIYGLDKIQSTKNTFSFTRQEDSLPFATEQKLHTLLLQEGLQEVITCDLVSPEMNQINGNESVQISALNYMSKEQSTLRTSLLANHLQVLKHNQDHQNPDVHIYEIGKVYRLNGERFEEKTHVMITLMGQQAPYHYSAKENGLDFFHLKGMLENIFSSLSAHSFTFKKSNPPHLHPGIQAEIFSDDRFIGICGELHPAILRKSGIKKPVILAELELAPLIALSQKMKSFSPISPFPSSERDWTLTCSDELEIGELFQAIHTLSSPLLKEVFLLDIYKSEKIGAARKNVTLRFVYRNDKKTISFEAVEIEHAKIIKEVQAQMKNLIIQPT